MVKDMELQKLHGTIKALQKVVTDTGVVLEQERLDFSTNLQDARRQIELLRLRDDMAVVDDSDAASEVTYDRRLLKDIQLDLVQTTTSPTPTTRSRARHHRRRNGSTEADKLPPLGLWSVVRASRQEEDDDLRPPQSEASAERGRRSCSSEVSQLTVVKDLSVDKQELLPRPPTAMEAPHREWKKKVIERLSADAQRLVDLQSIVGELRASAEAAPELEDVTAQMVDAESAIAQLIDTNGKLLRKAEEFTSADAATAGDDLRSRSQRKILERVRKMSEKIARLEQETQRFQHALLRHEEERATRRAAAAAAAAASSGKSSSVQRRSSRVQLVEYLYGRRRDSRRQRRGPSCCMRAKAIDD